MVDLNENRSHVWSERALEGIVDPEQLKNMHPLETWEIGKNEIGYLLDRFGWLIFWNAEDLTAPGELKPLSLPAASPHYLVYDRGSCLVATPKHLFSDDRAHHDCLNTAAAMIQELAKRGWTVQMAGPQSALRFTWMSAQFLPDAEKLQFLGYSPDRDMIRLYHQFVRDQRTQAPSISPSQEGG